MVVGSEDLYRALRHQFEDASRPRPSRVPGLRPEAPVHARDPCYRFELDGWCRRGLGCPFRHGSARSSVAPYQTESGRSSDRVPTTDGCGTPRPTSKAASVETRGVRGRGLIHVGGDKRPTSKVAPAAVVPEEASVAAALLSHYRDAAEHKGANEDDVELLADEYVYDEEALRASLASAAQAAVSCGTPAVAGLSSGFSGRLVKQED